MHTRPLRDEDRSKRAPPRERTRGETTRAVALVQAAHTKGMGALAQRTGTRRLTSSLQFSMTTIDADRRASVRPRVVIRNLPSAATSYVWTLTSGFRRNS